MKKQLTKQPILQAIKPRKIKNAPLKPTFEMCEMFGL